MRILLDESAPRGLKRLLAAHDVQTVAERDWTAKSNGELLELAAAKFDVFITADQAMPHQQNLTKFDLAVIILAAGRNRIATYEPLAEKLKQSVVDARKGEALRFTA